MSKIIVTSVIILSLILCVSESRSADWRIYTEIGGMNVTENKINEGHKSYHKLGIEGIWKITD